MATRQTRRDAWPIFLVGATSILSVYVLGAYYFGYTVAGNGLRLVPEFDVIAVLLVACVIAQAWKHPMLRSGIIVLLFAACFPASKYLRHAWTIFPRAKSVTSRCEYTLAKWMHLNRPAARALPSGSVRFWYDAWDDNAQALGASEEGMLNQNLPAANWAITQGIDPAPAIQWLQALGVDAIIVPFKTSQEIFHDYAHPEKFQGVLDVLYDDRKGNVIYRVPRRNAAIARIVDRKTILSTSPQAIDRYASVVEHDAGARLTMQRRDFNAVDIDATVAEGQSLLFQETFDRAWHAFSGGQPLTIERDPLGFMLVSLTPGPHQIQLRFETPLEVRVGWLISAVTVLASIGALWRR